MQMTSQVKHPASSRSVFELSLRMFTPDAVCSLAVSGICWLDPET